MAASFKIGQVVTLNVVQPSGPVKQLSVDQEGNILYLVSWTDPEGVEQERWFKESELKTA